MNTATLITILGTLLGAGGLAGAAVAIAKLRPEAGQIVVKSAESAVIVQSGVIDDLKDELTRLSVELTTAHADRDALRLRLSELERTSQSVAVLQGRVEHLTDENNELRSRVKNLELENIQLREELSVVKETTNGNDAR